MCMTLHNEDLNSEYLPLAGSGLYFLNAPAHACIASKLRTCKSDDVTGQPPFSYDSSYPLIL
jgi:hypothetical protein